MSEITNKLLQVNGVQNVLNLTFTNLSGGNYSPYGYDIKAATKNNVLYPSLDPSIFEIRYPDTDIRGRCITY